jgi:hypothetical protein
MVRLTAALKELQQERLRAVQQVKRLDEVITALGKLVTRNGVMPAGSTRVAAKRRTMSAAARRRIAAAQKARWAKWKAAQGKKGT